MKIDLEKGKGEALQRLAKHLKSDPDAVLNTILDSVFQMTSAELRDTMMLAEAELESLKRVGRMLETASAEYEQKRKEFVNIKGNIATLETLIAGKNMCERRTAQGRRTRAAVSP
jgi:hypothetical protein